MLIGIKCEMQKDGKKVLVTAVLGGYDSFNTGAKMKKNWQYLLILNQKNY